MRAEEGWLHSAKGGHGAGAAGDAGLDLWATLGLDPAAAFFRGREFRTRALCSTLALLRQLLATVADCDAASAIFAPPLAALDAVLRSAGACAAGRASGHDCEGRLTQRHTQGWCAACWRRRRRCVRTWRRRVRQR